MAENRINGFVLARSSVNGRENISQSIDVSKIYRDQGKDVDDNELGHKADLRESLLRRETGNAEAESFVIEGPLHGQETSISGFRVGTRRKSEAQSLPRATLTPQAINTRRKSTSELELEPDDRRRTSPQNSENLRLTSVPFTGWNEGDMFHERRDTSHNNYENDRVVQTSTFPAMSRVNFDEGEELKLSFSGRAHRKESKFNRLKSEESATVNSERLVHFENDSPTHKPSLLDPGQGNLLRKRTSDQELTRSRSFSDSEVEDPMRISAEQREKLERLKRQILEKNLKGKGGRKVSGVQQSTGLTGESRFPVLTEKSLKRYAKYHETAHAAASLSTINADQRISALTDVSSEQYQNSDIETASNAEKTSGEFIAAPSLSTLTYSENNPIIERKAYGSDIPSPPNSEDGDFESISTISVARSRARSEPGNVATRKVSTVQQLQNRSRSETYQLNTKVQSFVKKPLPALPPSTLRVKKQAPEKVTSKAGHFKAGANANVALERSREKKEGVINIHTCPNMNLFSDNSWMYQELSRKKHRYIRAPATPVPPAEFVFRKDEPDS